MLIPGERLSCTAARDKPNDFDYIILGQTRAAVDQGKTTVDVAVDIERTFNLVRHSGEVWSGLVWSCHSLVVMQLSSDRHT